MHTVTYSMPCEQWFLQVGRNTTASQTASNRLLLWRSRLGLRIWECARKLWETLHQSSQNLAIWVSQRMLFYPTKTFCFFYIYFIAKILCFFGIRAKEINGALEEFSGIQGSCGSCWANTVKRFSVYFSLASLFFCISKAERLTSFWYRGPGGNSEIMAYSVFIGFIHSYLLLTLSNVGEPNWSWIPRDERVNVVVNKLWDAFSPRVAVRWNYGASRISLFMYFR